MEGNAASASCDTAVDDKTEECKTEAEPRLGACGDRGTAAAASCEQGTQHDVPVDPGGPDTPRGPDNPRGPDTPSAGPCDRGTPPTAPLDVPCDQSTQIDASCDQSTQLNMPCDQSTQLTSNEKPAAEDAIPLEFDSLAEEQPAGSDSGVEGCGRVSSGAGSRSCASSVVSCGSGCGSESSSLTGAPARRRRPAEPARRPPAVAPRPATAPRGPNLATRERARSREKPALPEKPRPLTPKPRIRPTVDLPNLVRESPALRAKPTKTSAARCRTPSSPGDDKRWGAARPAVDACAARAAADKYGTLPRRRRDDDGPPPDARRPVARAGSARAAVRPRVRIYAEKNVQTVLLGSDVEAALGGLTPNIESRAEVPRCHRGVQASARGAEARLAAAAAGAEAALGEERARRAAADAALAAERAARLQAQADLEANALKLLELAGDECGGGAGGAARGLAALESQLRAGAARGAQLRAELSAKTDLISELQTELSAARERGRALAARLAEAERDAAEMQEFLAAETAALAASLRDADAAAAAHAADLALSRSECRQLVRLCEQRRQEALAAAARARGAGGARRALDALAGRVRALAAALRGEPLSITSSLAATPESERRRARASCDECSRHSDDLSRDLLDDETEPPPADPELADEWWSEPGAAWSGSEQSPRSEGDASLRELSAAIARRQRSEDGGWALAETARRLEAQVDGLLRSLDDERAPRRSEPADGAADGGCRRSYEAIMKHLEISSEEINIEQLEEELRSCPERERRDRYEALDAALAALSARAPTVRGWPRLLAARRALEALAFALALPTPPPAAPAAAAAAAPAPLDAPA